MLCVKIEIGPQAGGEPLQQLREKGVLIVKKGGLHAFVRSGASAGELLFPHKHEDGAYVVSMTRFEKDYIRLMNENEILAWLEKGYRLRMSNPNGGITAPSLIRPESIFRPVVM